MPQGQFLGRTQVLIGVTATPGQQPVFHLVQSLQHRAGVDEHRQQRFPTHVAAEQGRLFTGIQAVKNLSQKFGQMAQRGQQIGGHRSGSFVQTGQQLAQNQTQPLQRGLLGPATGIRVGQQGGGHLQAFDYGVGRASGGSHGRVQTVGTQMAKLMVQLRQMAGQQAGE